MVFKNIKSVLLLVLLTSFVSCSKQLYTADIDTSYYRVSKRNKSDAAIDKMILPYKTDLDAKMNIVIAYNPSEMSKSKPNSALGNWFSDILLEEASDIYGQDIDFAVQNYGGIRVPSLGKGDVTVGNIYELMPFDNQLVLLTMNGKITQQLLDRIAILRGWPISKTLSFTIANEKAIQIKIKGEDFDINKTYTVAIADYIANGGDQCFFLEDAEREDNDILIRNLLIDHLKNKTDKTIDADSRPRIATNKM